MSCFLRFLEDRNIKRPNLVAYPGLKQHAPIKYYFIHCRNENLTYLCTALENNAQHKNHGSVVQLVRMPPCHGGGRGFESRPDRKKAIQQ